MNKFRLIGLALTVLLATAVLFTGCPNAAKGGKTPAPAEYAVNFSVDGGNGTLKAEVDGAEIAAGAKVQAGKTVKFTAAPKNASTHEVDAWTISGGTFIAGGGTGSTTAELKAGANVTVTVKFKPKGGTPPASGKTYKAAGVSFTMKAIDAVTEGELGSASQEGSATENDNVPHKVNLKAYSIGETEVTQELWQAVMGSNPSEFNGTPGKEPAPGEEQAKRPVENVNWFECAAFCNELTKKTDGMSGNDCVYYSGPAFTSIYTKDDAKAQKEVYFNKTKNGFRLPTEAEWEWAAKGGEESKWAGTSDKARLGEYAWYEVNAGSKTHEVKKKKANGYGLYDMSGNVFEWCWDRYAEIKQSDTLTDPLGPDSGSERVDRGGSWNDDANYCVCAFRDCGSPMGIYNLLGMRLAAGALK